MEKIKPEAISNFRKIGKIGPLPILFKSDGVKSIATHSIGRMKVTNEALFWIWEAP